MRGLRALDAIPRGGTIAAIPSSAIFSPRRMPQYLLEQDLFADIPDRFEEFHMRLRLAYVLFFQSFNPIAPMAPWVGMLPESSNNVVSLLPHQIDLILKDRVSTKQLELFKKTVASHQHYMDSILKRPVFLGIFESLASFHSISVNEVKVHFLHCLSQTYSRCFFLPFYQKEFKQPELDDPISSARVARKKIFEDFEKVDSTSAIDSNDESPREEELCFVPLLDLINHPPPYADPNVHYEYIDFSKLTLMDRKLIMQSFKSSGMTKEQMQLLGDEFLVINATEMIEKGDHLYLDYLDYIYFPTNDKLMEMLFFYGFVPQKL